MAISSRTLTKPLIAAGVLLAAAGGVLAWQLSSQLGVGHDTRPVSAASASRAQGDMRPGVPAGDSDSGLIERPGGGPTREVPSGRQFEWASESDDAAEVEAMRREMALNGALPPDGPLKFVAFEPGDADLRLIDRALESGVTSGEWASLASAWESFVRPLVVGDAEAFTRSVEEMGGFAEASGRLFDRLSGYLQGVSMAWDSSRVRRANVDDGPTVPGLPDLPEGMTLPEGAVPMMAMVSEISDDAGETVRTHTVNIPLVSVFPAIAELDESARQVEMWTPLRFESRREGEADLGMSVFLARTGNRWTPSAVRLGLRSDEANERFRAVRSAAAAARSDAMAERRAESDDGSGGGG